MERTVLARVHYDGTRFAGWQRQRSDRTVQGEFEAVLERLCGRRVAATAAGRTDAGVHALGMAVSAAVPERWTPDALRRALNALLPADCWVEGVSEVREGFNARRSATARTYEYRIGTDEGSRSPFRRPYEWALGRALAGEALHASASLLPGTHDFQAFAVQTASKRHCRCTVREVEWRERGHERGWTFRIRADRFLHHMVRILVGTMTEVALGRRAVEDVARLLAVESGVRAAAPAPPEGLYFIAAEYPSRWFAEVRDAA